MRNKKSMRQRINEAGIIGADKMIAKRDGTFEFRRGYFYRHGMTAEKFARGIERELQAKGFDTARVAFDDVGMGPWKSESYNYFFARFRVVEKGSLVRRTESELAEEMLADGKAEADERDAKLDLFA